jgi:hypothetical protein
MSHEKIHAARVKTAKRKLRRKRMRWQGKTVTSQHHGGSHQCTAPRRKSINVSRMRKHG